MLIIILSIISLPFSVSPMLTNRKIPTTVPVLESLDNNYRIYGKQYLMNKTKDNIHKRDADIKNNTNNKSRIAQNGHYLPMPERLMSHKMSKTPKQSHHNIGSKTNSKSLEISKKVTIILGDLLVDYDRNQRPGQGGPEAVITSNLEIRSMGPISELDMEYSLDCYFRQKWLDRRLEFSGPSEFLSLNINMLDKIWKPDTYFHTGKGSHLHTITRPNKFLRIYQNGGVLYSMRLTIKSSCPMDLHHFPMDKQSCPLIFGSYGYPNDQVVYNWDKKPVSFSSSDFTLSQFDLLTTPYRNGTVRFQRGNYSMLQVNFNLRRHVGYFLIQIYVPCSLIVVLSWVSFWINREATADRVGLGVTAVLTLSTFGLDSRSDLPRVSYATALDWFTIMCFLFVVFTLLEFAGVHYFTKVGTGEVPFVEIDEDWAQEKCEDDNENPLNIIAPPKAYQSDEKKINRYDGKQKPMSNSKRRAKKYRIYDTFDLKYSNIYCPKHGFKSIDSHLDKFRRFESLEQYLNDRIKTNELNEQMGSDASDDNYEDIDDNDLEYEMDLNSQFNRFNDQYISSSNTTTTELKSGFTSKLLKFFLHFWYCLTVSQSYKEQMKRRRVRGQGLTAANSVSLIDKTSRILFPFVWFLLNLIYWVFLINERNSEFKMWSNG